MEGLELCYMSAGELARLVKDAGCTPVQRDSLYTHFRRYQDPPAPGRPQLPVAGQVVS